MIYLDHLSTTPCAPEVIEAMSRCLQEDFGNPSSAHALGWAARERVEEARASVARALSIRPQRVTFTSGATESTHIALMGAFERVPLEERGGVTLLSQVSEHSATLGPLKALSQRHGCALRLAPITELGQVDIEAFAQRLDRSVRVVSLMHVNNELGVVQPIEELVSLARAHAHPECLIHVDGAQAVGKLELRLDQLDVDLYSLSAHKFYGPKGAGALCVWPRHVSGGLPSVLHGGGQERGLRPGTVATHQAVGLGVAASLIGREGERARVEQLTERLREALESRGATLNGAGERVSGAISALCPPELLALIEERWAGEVAYSQASACHSGSGAPSHVLSALGLSPEEASRTVRLCVGRYTTAREIDRALQLLA